MTKRRENDPKRRPNFEKMGKALGFYSYETGLGGTPLFSSKLPGDSPTVHRTTVGSKGERIEPGKGHVHVSGDTRPVVEGVAGISKKKSE